MPSDLTDWKQALFGYVNLINEAGLRGDADRLREIPDPQHRKRLAGRLRSTRERDREFGLVAKPNRSETRARIERYNVGRGEAVADVALHAVRSFEQRGQPWIEERVERERIRFIEVGSRWRLDGIQPIGTEHRPDAYDDPYDIAEDEWDRERKSVMPSVPYLNSNAVSRTKSRVFAGSGAGGDYAYGAFGRNVPYRREAAVAYAERWWNEPNPQYENFEVNCTNYVSQCLFAGGAPMNYTGRRESGWWYKGRPNKEELWSFSWAVANGLQQLLATPRSVGLRAERLYGPESLELGDVICYDWDGKGRIQHNTIVTAFTPEGMPLVNANTVSSRHRYWDYRDSYAWTEQTQYRFFHITDDF